ncbi:SCY1-like protein 2 [Aplysia californica]|uniref:SCY1-like protein 2 n=1 Tax=Aplysia californica TaxID=6500 RepID=A0ABM1VUK9_APLCA|nr:SCY1-like protein 2 [Aplysia californica]
MEIIMPEFRAILGNTKPVQATVYILNKLDIVLSKSPLDEIKGEVLPFVFNTLDSSSLQAQEAALGAIGVIKEYLDDNILRKVVLPKAKSLFFRSSNVKVGERRVDVYMSSLFTSLLIFGNQRSYI